MSSILRNAGPILCSTCLIVGSISILSSCATSRQQKDPGDQQKIEALTNQNKQLEATIAALSAKIDSLDTKVGSMNDKVDQTRSRMDNLAGNVGAPRAKSKSVQIPAVDENILGTEGSTVASSGPEAGYVTDEAVQKYRSAMILFEAHNYPEAVLSFSSFVDQFPDHPLAGDAQYFLGESYFKQKEYKLAIRELNRVLTTYDRSSHISDALRDLAISEDAIGDKESAARHRQELLSLFPNSPAAAENSETIPTSAPAPTPQTQVVAPSMSIPETTEAPQAQPPASPPQANPQPNSAPTSNEAPKTTEKAVAPPALDAPPPTAPETPPSQTPQ